EHLQPERSLSQTPLFQVLFGLQNAPMPMLEAGPLRFEPVEAYSNAGKFDLSFSLIELGGQLEGTLHYNQDLFDRPTAEGIAARYLILLESAVERPQSPIDELPLLTPGERRQILVDWNDTQVDYPRGLCLHERIEAQAARSPQAEALVFEGKT